MGASESRGRARSRDNYAAISRTRDRSRSPRRSRSADARSSISSRPLNPGLGRDREFEVMNAAYLFCHDLQNIHYGTLAAIFQAQFVILRFYPDATLRRLYNDKEILLIYAAVLESMQSRINSHSIETLDRLRKSENLRSLIYKEWDKLMKTLRAAKEGSYAFYDDTTERFGVCQVPPDDDGICRIRNKPASTTTALETPVRGLIKALEFLSDVLFYPELPLDLAIEKVKRVLNRLLTETQVALIRLNVKIDFETSSAGYRPPEIQVEMEQQSRPVRGILRDPNVPRGHGNREVQFTRSARRASLPQRFRNFRYSIFGGNEYPTHTPRIIPPPRNFAAPLTNMIPTRGTVLRTSPNSPPRQRSRRSGGFFRSIRRMRENNESNFDKDASDFRNNGNGRQNPHVKTCSPSHPETQNCDVLRNDELSFNENAKILS